MKPNLFLYHMEVKKHVVLKPFPKVEADLKLQIIKWLPMFRRVRHMNFKHGGEVCMKWRRSCFKKISNRTF